MTAAVATAALPGCARHQERPMITAVGLSPGNQCETPGIPYYLPKPLLVVAKNVRHIDETKVGLTGPVPIPGGFDNQAAYGDIKANVTVPSSPGGEGKAAAAIEAAKVNAAAVSDANLVAGPDRSIVEESMTPSSEASFNDGLEVDSFYTYQVVFIPDLTQKYGLQISGGAGEFRAAMNMVNGWMYTGMGPFYMKDSSSAQNAMATGVAAMYTGRGVADVVSSVGDLASQFTGTGLGDDENTLTDQQMLDFGAKVKAIEALAASAPKVPQTMLNFAEIYIYEPELTPEQTTQWRLVAEHHFDRQYLATSDSVGAADARQRVYNQILQDVILGPAAPPDHDFDHSETGPADESGVTSPNPAGPETLPPTPGVPEPDLNANPPANGQGSTGSGASTESYAQLMRAIQLASDDKALQTNTPIRLTTPTNSLPQVQVNVAPPIDSSTEENNSSRPPTKIQGIADFLKNLHQNPVAEQNAGDSRLRAYLSR